MEMKAVCKNPWCKATFFYKDDDMIKPEIEGIPGKVNEVLDEVEKIAPRVCQKCRSFDTELSGGVSWTEKKYEGPRFDGLPHQMRYKITNWK